MALPGGSGDFGTEHVAPQCAHKSVERIGDVRVPTTAVVHAATWPHAPPSSHPAGRSQELGERHHVPVKHELVELITEQAAQVPKITPHKDVSHRVADRCGDVLVPLTVEAVVQAPRAHEELETAEQFGNLMCGSPHTVEQTVDVPMPVTVKEVVQAPGNHQVHEFLHHLTRQTVQEVPLSGHEQVVHAPKATILRCVSHRTVEQPVDVSTPVELSVDVTVPVKGEGAVQAPVVHQELEMPNRQTRQVARVAPKEVPQVAEQVIHVPKVCPQSCAYHHTVEQLVGVVVHVPAVHQEQESHDDLTGQIVQGAPQTVHEPVEQIGEQCTHVPKLIPLKRASHHAVDQIGDKLVPSTVEEVVLAQGVHPAGQIAQEAPQSVHEPVEQVVEQVIAISTLGTFVDESCAAEVAADRPPEGHSIDRGIEQCTRRGLTLRRCDGLIPQAPPSTLPGGGSQEPGIDRGIRRWDGRWFGRPPGRQAGECGSTRTGRPLDGCSLVGMRRHDSRWPGRPPGWCED